MSDNTETVKLVDVDPDRARKLAQSLHRKKDDIDLTRKSIIVDHVEPSADADERAIVARVSTPDRDRDGEVVEPKGIDLTHFNANPCLLWSHKYDIPPIGRAMWSRVDDGGLRCKFEFAKTQFADEIYGLYRDGFLKTFSIGFIPLEFDTKEKVHRRVSLLEVSAVPVPSNPYAKVEAMQKGMITSPALKADLGIDDTPAQVPTIATLNGEPATSMSAETKIDATDEFQRISVSGGHEGHASRTIIISADEGIWARYCGDCRTVTTYLFDVNRWSMEQAAVWIESHRATAAEPSMPKGEESMGVVTTETPSPEPTPDLAALIDALASKVDALSGEVASMRQPVPAPTPAPPDPPKPKADPDVITIDEPAAPPAPTADGEIDIESLVVNAVGRIDLKAIIADRMDIALKRLRGRVE